VTAACTIGTVALGGDYVAATTSFSGNGSNASSIVWNPTSKIVTITFGNGSGSKTGVPVGVPSYTPASGLTDLAGNPLATTSINGTSSRL